MSALDKLPELTDSKRQTAKLLRDMVEHYVSSSPSGGVKEALDRIIR